MMDKTTLDVIIAVTITIIIAIIIDKIYNYFQKKEDMKGEKVK